MPSAKHKRGTGSVFQRGSIWWIKYYVHGKPFPESSKSTVKADAVRLLKVRLAEVATGLHAGVGSIKVSALLELVIEDYIECGTKELRNAKWRIDAHLKPMLGHIRASEFGSKDIKAYVKARRSGACCKECNGVEPATINRELALLRRAFTLALESDPPMVARAPTIKLAPENNVRKGFLEHEDYRKVRDELGRAKLAFVIAYHLGMRRGEILSLKWGQVDLKNGVIRLDSDQVKNKTGRTAPIYGEMREWLTWAYEARTCEWVCEDEGGRILDIRKGWKSAVKRAGLPGLLVHDMRRSAVRNMVRAGVSQQVAMEISGHKTDSMFRRYNITDEKDIQKAGAQMEKHFSYKTGSISDNLEGYEKQ